MLKLVETYNSNTMTDEYVLLDDNCKPTSFCKKLLVIDILSDICLCSAIIGVYHLIKGCHK